MQLIREELKIITAALRINEMAFETMAGDERARGRWLDARRLSTSSAACKTLADKLDEYSAAPGEFSLRRSEHELIIATLRSAAAHAVAAENEKRLVLDRVGAEQHSVFAAGCGTVADKWEREKPAAVSRILLH